MSIVGASQVFLSMAKVGLTGFGGGNALISLVEHEAVTVRAWMTSEQFKEAIGMSYAVPGLSAGKLAAFVGYTHAGVPGLLAGIIGLWLPGMLCMLALFYLLKNFSDTWWYPRLLKGFLFASAGLVAASVFSALPAGDLRPTLPFYIIGLLLAAAVFVIVRNSQWNIPPIAAVIGAGLIGLLVFRS